MRAVLPLAVTAFLMTGSAASRCETVAVPTFESANDLLEVCGARGDYEQGLCTGYIQAIADAMSHAQAVGGTVAGWRACVPNRVIFKQIRDAAVLYLTAHAELRRASTVWLVARALAETFPCRP